MILLIAGSTHTGKTLLAQRLLERIQVPYLSIDHLKMGLIRSHICDLRVDQDHELCQYLWGILKEIIKTNLENRQNLIIEGCYIPFDWKEAFTEAQLRHIRYLCLVMSEDYIRMHKDQIIAYEHTIEQRKYPGDIAVTQLIKENQNNMQECQNRDLSYHCFAQSYDWQTALDRCLALIEGINGRGEIDGFHE